MATPADTAEFAALREATAPRPMSSGGGESPTHLERQVSELQNALHERDQIVQMLTERLEQAADQLDRFQRSGSERRGPASSGMPTDFVEGQQTLLDQMTRVLAEWEELQAAQMLSRIELQILELKDLIGSRDPAAISQVAPAKATARAASVPAAAPAEAKSGWEAIKASMMAGDSPSEPESAARTEPTTVEPTVVESPPEVCVPGGAAKVSEPLPPLPSPPRIIDIDKAPIEALRDAVESRDDFILALLRRVATQSQTPPLPDWDRLNQAPVELRRSLEDLQQRLQATLRVTEVDLSLQRAKLAREESRLQIKSEQVVRQMRQLGLAPAEPGDPPNNAKSNAEANAGQNVQSRRWLQFLQRSAPGSADPEDKGRAT